MESWVQLLHTLSYTWVEPVYQCLIVHNIDIVKQDGHYWYQICCRGDGRVWSGGPFRSLEEAIEYALKGMEEIYRAWETEPEAA